MTYLMHQEEKILHLSHLVWELSQWSFHICISKNVWTENNTSFLFPSIILNPNIPENRKIKSFSKEHLASSDFDSTMTIYSSIVTSSSKYLQHSEKTLSWKKTNFPWKPFSKPMMIPLKQQERDWFSQHMTNPETPIFFFPAKYSRFQTYPQPPSLFLFLHLHFSLQKQYSPHFHFYFPESRSGFPLCCSN